MIISLADLWRARGGVARHPEGLRDGLSSGDQPRNPLSTGLRERPWEGERCCQQMMHVASVVPQVLRPWGINCSCLHCPSPQLVAFARPSHYKSDF